MDLAFEGRETGKQRWTLTDSRRYDFTVSGDSFERRFAGRMETGAHGISDPAMGTAAL